MAKHKSPAPGGILWAAETSVWGWQGRRMACVRPHICRGGQGCPMEGEAHELQQLNPFQGDWNLPELPSSVTSIHTAWDCSAAAFQGRSWTWALLTAQSPRLPQSAFGTDRPSKKGLRLSLLCRRDGHCLSELTPCRLHHLHTRISVWLISFHECLCDLFWVLFNTQFKPVKPLITDVYFCVYFGSEHQSPCISVFHHCYLLLPDLSIMHIFNWISFPSPSHPDINSWYK